VKPKAQRKLSLGKRHLVIENHQKRRNKAEKAVLKALALTKG
jgi:hypothetical protein